MMEIFAAILIGLVVWATGFLVVKWHMKQELMQQTDTAIDEVTMLLGELRNQKERIGKW